MPIQDNQPGEKSEGLEKNQTNIDNIISGGELKESKEELLKILQRNKEQLGQDQPLAEKKEMMEKESLEKEREIMQQFDKEKQLQPTPAAAPNEEDEAEKAAVKKHAEEIYAITDPAQQIEKIIQLATTRDPYYAVKVAQHLDDNYILNEVHDGLVEDKVRLELIKRGLLEEI